MRVGNVPPNVDLHCPRSEAMPSILLISYWFPPNNVIGAVRALEIAKHFANNNWKVTVLATRDQNFDFGFDADLTNVNVTYVPASAITAWLTDFAGATAARTSRWSRMRQGAARYGKAIARSLCFPDPHQFVIRDYTRFAEVLHPQESFDLIVTSALPFSMHVVGRKLSRRFGVPWIADNRDLWAISPYRKLAHFRKVLDVQYERRILNDAAHVLGISQHMVDYYRHHLRGPSVHLVMNGYDEHESQRPTGTSLSKAGEDLGEKGPTGITRIAYLGILYGGRRDISPLLDAINSQASLASAIHLDFYGSEKSVVEGYIRIYPRLRITCFPRISKEESLRVQQTADLLLVAIGNTEFEKGVLTGKFFEYLSSRKPILALGPSDSELARIVNEHSLGYGGNSVAAIAAYLDRLLDGREPRSVGLPSTLSRTCQLDRLREIAEQSVNHVEN